MTPILLARGGGGGSSGGGGGAGGLLQLIVFIILGITAYFWRRHLIKKANQAIAKADTTDTSWDPASVKQLVAEVFYQFEKDWSQFDVEAMTPYVTKRYRQRMVLELATLRQMNRQNLMRNLKINSLNFIDIEDEPGKDDDSFTIEVKAVAEDYLVDLVTKQTLYLDKNPFKEYWTFNREEQGIWKLHEISQFMPAKTTMEHQFEDALHLNQPENSAIHKFAAANDFFYDADFGRLILPNHGVLFKDAKFAHSDINDHVIGLYKNVIVQFYRYVPLPNQNSAPTTYTIAQVVLPKAYGDIMVVRRHWLQWRPKGLKASSLEDPDFNKRFRVWANDLDRVEAFELLTPNFMEKILGLKFELNIEVVDSTLYLYTKGATVDFASMLEVLTWAFDEMKL